jgi:hypothetical protein
MAPEEAIQRAFGGKPPDKNTTELRDAIQRACEAQNVGVIVAGRQSVLDMPRDWVLENIEEVAAASLNLSDEWEYRRLLELSALLDAALVQRLAVSGLNSNDPDIRETAGDFIAKSMQ